MPLAVPGRRCRPAPALLRTRSRTRMPSAAGTAAREVRLLGEYHPVAAEDHRGACTGAVVLAGDEAGRHPPLQVDGPPAPGQLVVGRHGPVRQQIDQACGVRTFGDRVRERRPAAQHLRPGGAEFGIGETVDAGLEIFAVPAVGRVDEPLAVEQQQVEAPVGRRVQSVGEFVRTDPAGEESLGQEPAAERRLGGALLREIGDRGEPAGAAHAEPGAAGGEVAAGEQVGAVFPILCRAGRARVEFVAIGRHHQRVGRIRIEGEQHQAHRACVILIGGPDG
jgi:hypothetical protein